MNTILYRPLEKIVRERENFINGNYDDAQNADVQTQTLLEKKAEKLAKTKVDAKSIMKTNLDDANNKSLQIIEESKNKNAAYIQAEKENLKQQSIEITNSMEKDTKNLAQLISDKLLRSEINE